MAIPVIYLAYVNDGKNNLPQLSKEMNDIERKIKYLDTGGFLRIDKLTDADSDRLFEYLDPYTQNKKIQELRIFHFAGHAGGKKLLLDDGILHTDGLAAFFEHFKDSLQLVFLNGCSTLQQVEALHKAGIPAVIATSHSISDTKAANFALWFYEAFIVNGHTLEGAFKVAVSRLQATNILKAYELPKLFRGASFTDEEDDFPWGLYVHEDKKETLQSYFRRSIPSDISYMPVRMESSVNAGVQRIVEALKKNGAYINEKNDAYKKKGIVMEFSWIIGEPLRKLFMPQFNQHNQERLRLLLDTYASATRFLAYILLSQIIEEKHKGTISGTSLEALTYLQKENFNTLNFREIQNLCWQELKAKGINPFMIELNETLSNLEKNEQQQQMFEFLETVRNRLYRNEIAAEEMVELSRKCEAILTELLISNAFLARYRLITIKDINITHYRFRQPTFAHTIGELHDLYVDNFDEIQSATFLDNYAYSHSVILLKKDMEKQLYEAANYLILSPLIIDRSAYDMGKSTPEIYYLAWSDAQKHTYANIKYDNIDAKDNYFMEIGQDNQDAARNVLFEQMLIINP